MPNQRAQSDRYVAYYIAADYYTLQTGLAKCNKQDQQGKAAFNEHNNQRKVHPITVMPSSKQRPESYL
jgi:hypothetical protein